MPYYRRVFILLLLYVYAQIGGLYYDDDHSLFGVTGSSLSILTGKVIPPPHHRIYGCHGNCTGILHIWASLGIKQSLNNGETDTECISSSFTDCRRFSQ